MSDRAVDVRLATGADLDALTALLVAQLREHHVTTPEARIARAIRGVLDHPERGRILVAVALRFADDLPRHAAEDPGEGAV